MQAVTVYKNYTHLHYCTYFYLQFSVLQQLRKFNLGKIFTVYLQDWSLQIWIADCLQICYFELIQNKKGNRSSSLNERTDSIRKINLSFLLFRKKVNEKKSLKKNASYFFSRLYLNKYELRSRAIRLIVNIMVSCAGLAFIKISYETITFTAFSYETISITVTYKY